MTTAVRPEVAQLETPSAAPAGFGATLSLARVPDAVVAHAKLLLLDTLGLAS